MVRDAIDPEAARIHLGAHPLLRHWPQAADLAKGVLRERVERNWHGRPRRTEFELPGDGKTGGGGRADLILWEPYRQSPTRIHLMDFKLAAIFTPAALDLHRFQLSAYCEAVAMRYLKVAIEAWVVGLEGGGWVQVIGPES